MGCSEKKLRFSVVEVKWEASFVDCAQLWQQLMMTVLLDILIESNRRVGPSRPSSNHSYVVPRIAGSIHICRYVYIVCPIDFLNKLSFVKIEDLELVCRGIAACQDTPVLEVKRFSRNIGPIDVPDAFPLAKIPNMNHWVPTTRNEGGVIDEFYSKNSVIMANMVPVCLLESGCHWLGLLVIDSDVAVLARSGKLSSTSIEVKGVDSILFFPDKE